MSPVDAPPSAPGDGRIPCVWSGRVHDLARVVGSAPFLTECQRRYAEVGFGKVGRPELQSWRMSWPPLVDALMRAGLGDLWLVLEFGTPGGSSRFDAVLIGSAGEAALAATVVELKQWTRGTLVGDDAVDVPGLGITTHPISQVSGYVGFLRHWFHHPHVTLEARGVALLHGAGEPSVDELRRRTAEGTVERDRHLLSADAIGPGTAPGELATAFRCNDLKGPTDWQVEAFQTARWYPDDQLLEQVGGILDGGHGVAALIGDQQDAFMGLMRIIEQSLRGAQSQTIVAVTGGPGSGKTLLAIKLLGRLFRGRLQARYLTPSGTLRMLLQEAANANELDDDRARAKKDLFLLPDKQLRGVDVAILDEAQRLSRHGGGFARYLRTNFHGPSVIVVFLDERQIIRPNEGVTEAEIRSAALDSGAEFATFSLAGCYRNNGSRAFGHWVDALLYDQPYTWTGADYELEVAMTPEELEAWVRQEGADVGRGRIAAGYCWEWTKTAPHNLLAPDVRIRWNDPADGTQRQWSMPWNAYGPRRLDGDVEAPESRLWASTDGGEGQVGCIYTAQGLEYDRAGVIIGPDLVRRGDAWHARPQYSRDPAMRGVSAEEYAKLARNIYRVLLTRGIQGCRMYSTDEETQRYLTSLVPKG